MAVFICTLIFKISRMCTCQLCVLGDSGGFVNSLDFCPASLKSLGCFYFRCALSSQWKAVKVTLPTLKAFFEARCHNVSGNKQ